MKIPQISAREIAYANLYNRLSAPFRHKVASSLILPPPDAEPQFFDPGTRLA